MKFKLFLSLLLLFISTSLFLSCQKEVDGSTIGVIIPAAQKPKVGTSWVYFYTTYYAYGAVRSVQKLTYKAKNEETLGGEKWLNIVDVATDTTVYYLNVKAGGLYQYTNNSSYLLCKYPAAINDTYNTFNDGAAEDFTVKAVNDTVPTGIGNIATHYYEGVKNGFIIDFIRYNNNAWIVYEIIWRKLPLPSSTYYRYSTLYIDTILY